MLCYLFNLRARWTRIRGGHCCASFEAWAGSVYRVAPLHRRTTSLAQVYIDGVDVVGEISTLRGILTSLGASSAPTTATPTPAPTTVAPTTAVPTVAGVASSGDMRIYHSTDPAVLSTGTYPVTTSVGGYLQIDTNPGLTTMVDAFPRLTRVEQYLQIDSNANLDALGNAFPVLVELGTDSNGASLRVYNNAALQGFGTAFASLRRIPGTLYIQNNPLLTDWEALRHLECHGGVYQNSPTSHCQNCPTWLLAGAPRQAAMLKRQHNRHFDRPTGSPGDKIDCNPPHRPSRKSQRGGLAPGCTPKPATQHHLLTKSRQGTDTTRRRRRRRRRSSEELGWDAECADPDTMGSGRAAAGRDLNRGLPRRRARWNATGTVTWSARRSQCTAPRSATASTSPCTSTPRFGTRAGRGRGRGRVERGSSTTDPLVICNGFTNSE